MKTIRRVGSLMVVGVKHSKSAMTFFCSYSQKDPEEAYVTPGEDC